MESNSDINLTNTDTNITSYIIPKFSKPTITYEKVSVDKDIFLCNICLNICENAVQTTCCHNLFCKQCILESFKYSKKCPMCREELNYVPCIIIRKLIGSIEEDCPLCGFKEKKINMAIHINEAHKDEDPTVLFTKCRSKYDIKIFDEYPAEVNCKTHNHKLIMKLNHSEGPYECRGGLFYSKNNQNCVQKSEKEIFYYTCEQCNVFYCVKCAVNPNTNFYSHKHPHVLISIVRNNGWGCDLMHDPEGCKSGINDFYQTEGMSRFRCEECDYDSCEKCLLAHIKFEE
jgi:hypothetical protein